MEALFQGIFTEGLTPAHFRSLIVMLIILFIVMSIRNWMSNFTSRLLAYRKLRANEYVTEGAWCSLPTSTGSVDAKIDRITRHEVVLRNKDQTAWIHIPILQFADGQKVLLDASPR